MSRSFLPFRSTTAVHSENRARKTISSSKHALSNVITFSFMITRVFHYIYTLPVALIPTNKYTTLLVKRVGGKFQGIEV